MSRKAIFVVALLLLLAVWCSVALAQESTLEPDAPVIVVPEGEPVPDVVMIPAEPEGMPENVQIAIVIGVASVAGAVIVAVAYAKGKKPSDLYWQLPGAVTGWAAPAGWEYLMQRARQTASPADDEALVSFAKLLGYDVQEIEGGRFVLTKRAAPPS